MYSSTPSSVLENNESFNFMGVITEHNLNWHKHIYDSATSTTIYLLDVVQEKVPKIPSIIISEIRYFTTVVIVNHSGHRLK